MKRFFLSAVLVFSAGLAFAADPALKFSLDDAGLARIVPDLPKNSPYDFHPYAATDGSLFLGLTWVENGRAKLAFYALPLEYDGQPFPVPIPPGPVPPPVPPPPIPPDPPPIPPTPVVQKIVVVVIEETANSTPAFAKIRSSEKIREWSSLSGNPVFFLDVDAVNETGKTPPSFLPWLVLAQPDKLPLLIVQSKATKAVLDKMACPMTEAEFLKAVQKWGGK